MPKKVNKDVVLQHDPLAERFTDKSTASGSVKDVIKNVEVDSPKSNLSSVLIHFDKEVYQDIKRIAKSNGLSIRAFIRLATIEKMRRQ